MHIWRGLGPESQNFQNGTLTLGNFDGLHLGHRRLIEAVEKGPAPHVVITFYPHPVQVLFPERHLARLFPPQDLEEQLVKRDIDLLWILPFTRELAKKSAQEFARSYLLTPFHPQKIVVGYDFAFGHQREGTLEWLGRFCAENGIDLEITEKVMLDGDVISSRRIRQLILDGQVREAGRLLGRPFYLRGTVQKGAGRGRQLGYPTLNISVENEIRPKIGVYATRTRIKGRTYDSVTNVGRVPTFTDEKQIHVETHIMDQDIDAYGETIDVEFIAKIRPEKKFDSIDSLKKQIALDILEAKRELSQS